MISPPFVFLRPSLAQTIVAGLAGETLQDFSSGLFLALHRRTGKSTFLREDLIPACENRGWLPVYVDLWADRDADPADLIEKAIVSALRKQESIPKRLARYLSVSQVELFKTVKVDMGRPTLPSDTTLTTALQLLHSLSQQVVVLLIDEAQHALTSKDGVNAMFALKAARDALNIGMPQPGLRLVFTGSSRDKLANLLLSRSQPFYGARITPFPALDRDFIEAYAEHVNQRLAPDNQFTPSDLYDAFELVNFRPEMLSAIVNEVALGFGMAPNMGKLLKEGALRSQQSVWSEYDSSFNALTPLQAAVLVVLSQHGGGSQGFAPYAESTLQEIKTTLQTLKPSAQSSVTSGAVQKALNTLRDRDLIWKQDWGDYALEDTGMREWLAQKLSPPTTGKER